MLFNFWIRKRSLITTKVCSAIAAWLELHSMMCCPALTTHSRRPTTSRVAAAVCWPNFINLCHQWMYGKVWWRSTERTQSLLETEQESCAIAKMTAQCALYMGALKIFGTPWLRPRLLFPTFFTGFCSDRMFLQNLKSVALSVPQIIGGTPKNWTAPGYALVPFSRKFLIGFYSDWPYKCTRQILSP